MCITTDIIQNISIIPQILHSCLHKTPSLYTLDPDNHLPASLTIDVPFLESHITGLALRVASFTQYNVSIVHDVNILLHV